MSKQRLYLFVGYPGAGKTTIARLIAKKTGAVHLWADHERLKLFERPTHSKEESDSLYANLNQMTEKLLSEGKSVIFDTNFNFYSDREHLRDIAAKYGVETVLIWMQTPHDLAKQRAVHDANLRNGYKVVMTDDHFDALAAKLEQPRPEEHAIQIDGADLDEASVCDQLDLPA